MCMLDNRFEFRLVTKDKIVTQISNLVNQELICVELLCIILKLELKL